MPKITRYTDFQNGATADAEQLDAELNRIQDLVNGALDKDNVAPNGLISDNINDLDGKKVQPSTLPKTALDSTLTADLDSKEKTVDVDAKLLLKADKSVTYTKTEVDTALSNQNTAIRTDMTNGLALKSDQSTTYTKTEVDSALSSQNTAIRTDMNNGLNAKADQVNTYTKSEVDTIAGTKANSADVYTKTQVDSSLSNKEPKIVVSATAPAPAVDLKWIDTSVTPNVMKRYSGSDWVIIGGSGSGGGDTVTDSTNNGSILVNGAEIVVYDETNLANQVSQAITKNAADSYYEPIHSVVSSLPGTVTQGQVVRYNNADYIGVLDPTTQSKVNPAMTSNNAPSPWVAFDDTHVAGNDPFYALNGDTTNSVQYWWPGNDYSTSHYMGVGKSDGTTFTFRTLNIYSGSAGNSQNYPKSLNVQVSQDFNGSNWATCTWVTVKTVTDLGFTANYQKVAIDVGSDQTCKAVRLANVVAIGNASGVSPVIEEVELYSSGTLGWQLMAPSFIPKRTNILAYIGANQSPSAASQWLDVPFNTLDSGNYGDVNNEFNISTYTFTAKEAGWYSFNVQLFFTGVPDATSGYLNLTNSGGTMICRLDVQQTGVANGWFGMGNTRILHLSAGATVKLQYWMSNITGVTLYGTSGYSYLCIQRLYAN